jgi:hypothetical protein
MKSLFVESGKGSNMQETRQGAAGPMPEPVLEIVRFRLLEGITTADFLAAARQGEAALAGADGFIRRMLCQEAGSWADVVEWQSAAQAMAAAGWVMTHPDFAGFMAMIDPATVEMAHLPILCAMG